MTGQSDGGEVIGTDRGLLYLRARSWLACLNREVTSFGGLVARRGCFHPEI
jgi:hypothetical protein